MYIIAIIFNIILTAIIFKEEKQNSEWLEKAKTAYSENKNKPFYPRSEIALRKKHYLYSAVSFRTMIGAWLITIISIFFLEEKIFIMLYIGNYIYGRILYWLAIIEQKIEVVQDEVYKENDYL